MTVLAALLSAVAVLVWPGAVKGGRPVRERRHQPRDAAPLPPSPGLTGSQVAECAELLAVAMAGGAGLLPALDVVSRVVGGRAGHELRVVAAAVRWGVPLTEAWTHASAAWAPVAQAFVIAERAGAAPGAMLREAARAMRHTAGQRASVRAGSLAATIALPLGLTFLPGFVLTTVVPLVLGLAVTVTGG